MGASAGTIGEGSIRRPGLRLQAGFHEFVEVAVRTLSVSPLDAGAQVLDARLVQHVGTDLAAPAHVGLGPSSACEAARCASGSRARTAAPQHLHRRVAVLVLAALGLAGHDGMVGTWVMRTADSVLLTCWPPAPEEIGDVHLDVGRVDLDVDVVVDSGETNTELNEAGVAAVAGIERRLAHQAVHAGLGPQPAEGVVALNRDGGRL